VFINIEPLMGACIGVLLFGDHLTWALAAGGLMIIAGSFAVVLGDGGSAGDGECGADLAGAHLRPHQPSFPPLWREPLVQLTVRCIGAPARHPSAPHLPVVTTDREVPATRAGMTIV
jgi:hypothetical protein